jgi:Co/Zn/Cd efflux system component
LLSGGGHGHHHVHGHEHGVDEHDHDAIRLIDTAGGILTLQIFEDGVPPRFRLAAEGPRALPQHATIETVRPSGARQLFLMTSHGGYLESVDEISEPHAFSALLRLGRDESYAVDFEEHDHPGASADRDNNMRAAIIHVMADAVVSVLVIVGLLLARTFGWLFMDPVAGICGALVIASWSFGLIRDTGAILLDMNPDRGMEARCNRGRRRPAQRPASVAARPRPSWRHPVGRHHPAARRRTLSAPAWPFPQSLARYRRGAAAVKGFLAGTDGER